MLLAPAPAADAAPPPPSRLFLVVLENREYEEALGNPEAPYLEHLAEKGAVATNYYGVSHPSLPNYLALFAGSTFGIAENCTECVVSGPNLATQLSRAGITWRAYMQTMPEPCFAGSSYFHYAKRHNPFAYFPSITALPQRCRNVVPETRLLADLDRHRLPTFGWLTPDVCYDGHDCELRWVDRYLWLLLPRIVHQLGPHGLLVITFDEGLSDAGCCGVPGGGRVATILVGPDVPAGHEIRLPADHYSLLASIEDRFGLPRLRLARFAPPLAPALFGIADSR
ncbi:MAG TPA: alkaline phosphatase family protein [Solirubrobacterales bacterium]|nr:alkaline phosphatase family protein [Solirubrobacterales bacterium]